VLACAGVAAVIWHETLTFSTTADLYEVALLLGTLINNNNLKAFQLMMS